MKFTSIAEAPPMFIMQSMINLKPQTSNLKSQISNLKPQNYIYLWEIF